MEEPTTEARLQKNECALKCVKKQHPEIFGIDRTTISSEGKN